MAWYLAPSLSVLRSEVDARWPQRDKTSDGTIGDPAHQQRPSDHNPNARESVDAWDMDKDGVDVDAVLRAFERHPSAHYWIWDRQIADADNGWRPEPYDGDNPHTAHVHFSIKQSAAAEQDRRAWGVEDDMPTADEIAKAVWDRQEANALTGAPTRLGSFVRYSDWHHDQTRKLLGAKLDALAAAVAGQMSKTDLAAKLAEIDREATERAEAEVSRDAALRTELAAQLVTALREELTDMPAEVVEAAVERVIGRVEIALR
ncbi:hypothetical protein [Phytohabitans rumicis]|uniref:hypothetical protein n=1 Tax=Phytohabitans rumicis TaxID=1076125 RepID=UPI001564B1F2|nr:hypothetical protein [Phytohabitans rumicis]